MVQKALEGCQNDKSLIQKWKSALSQIEDPSLESYGKPQMVLQIEIAVDLKYNLLHCRRFQEESSLVGAEEKCIPIDSNS